MNKIKYFNRFNGKIYTVSIKFQLFFSYLESLSLTKQKIYVKFYNVSVDLR